ncbi:serine/threonine protein kinase, partial [Paenibacillus oleatilyticus]
MANTTDDYKNCIRKFFKTNSVIKTLLGGIEIGKEIGQGGNALVYNAVWGSGEVAVKVLAEDSSKQSSRYLRFITEVREIIKLSQTRAVVPIYHVGEITIEESTFPYMVMRKYPSTLNEWKKQKDLTNIKELSDVLEQLIYCVEVIHQNNIVHRDLKPQNILVDDDNDIVISDFGISWFDPNHYERLVRTEKRERLANFGFSAPEQFELNPEPKPTMDLFALGQLIQWLVTDSPVRGLGRTQLASIDESLAPLDSVVDQLLQNDPSKRPQDTLELTDLINSALKLRVKQESEEERVLRVLRDFDKIIRLACPGKMGIIQITDKEKINYIMGLLAAKCQDLMLWWTQGSADCPINQPIRHLHDNTWFIDHGEHNIEEIWVKKDDSYDHQYILLQCSPMPRFGIYEGEGYRYEEAAWFIDRYITRQEYDDGVADIDGKSVELEQRAELRTRELEQDFIFIATFANSINVDRNRSVVDEV